MYRREGIGRVDLADGLAKTGGGDLHGDAGLGDRLDQRFVIEASVPFRRRPPRAPDLHEIGVREDVVEA
jgi:hypothetical protein